MIGRNYEGMIHPIRVRHSGQIIGFVHGFDVHNDVPRTKVETVTRSHQAFRGLCFQDTLGRVRAVTLQADRVKGCIGPDRFFIYGTEPAYPGQPPRQHFKHNKGFFAEPTPNHHSGANHPFLGEQLYLYGSVEKRNRSSNCYVQVVEQDEAGAIFWRTVYRAAHPQYDGWNLHTSIYDPSTRRGCAAYACKHVFHAGFASQNVDAGITAWNITVSPGADPFLVFAIISSQEQICDVSDAYHWQASPPQQLDQISLAKEQQRMKKSSGRVTEDELNSTHLSIPRTRRGGYHDGVNRTGGLTFPTPSFS